jgi:hypothetical protein
MKMRHLLGSLALTGLVLAPGAQATTIIVNENFDSYADTAAMTAVWGGGGAGTLDTALSYSPSNSAAHPGGTVNTYTPGIGSVTPSLTEDLVLSAKIYDDAVVNTDRITVGLRTGAAPLFEMGRYLDNTIGFPEGNPYGIRALSLGNGITPSPNWRPFLSGGNPIASVAGWHTYEATFSIANGLTVTLDLGSDGIIDSTLQFAGDGASAFNNFTDLRFGGPSNLSSAGGGANFDDIQLALVTIIPEPASLLLAGAMGLVFSGMRPRR